MRLTPRVLAEFEAIVGRRGYVDDLAELLPSLTEWRGLYRGATPVMLMPATVEEAAAILAVCSRERVGVVPQGGNTGLVGGAIPHSSEARPEVLLSARRLKAIREIDRDNHTLTAEAGCVLSSLQAAARDAGRFFPLSLAAEGSCQLGGNLSTNAGGTSVLRYGNARDLVLGLEVVLPDGRIFHGLRGLRKDNTGYDLKQLFIGAEGTLGFITAATVKLFPEPRSVATALLALDSPAGAVALLSIAREQIGDELSACEFMSREALELVYRHMPGRADPLDRSAPWYVLLETASARPEPFAGTVLEEFLAACLDGGRITDGTVADSGAKRDALWAIRHDISAAQKREGASIKHDVSVPVSRVPDFLARASAWAGQAIPGVRVIAFGHLGDGNIHFNLSVAPGSDPGAFLGRWEEINRGVHGIAMDLGGSFSAEHGIGSLKAGELRHWRGGVALDLMQRIKAAIDPLGIMNPGKVLGPGA